MDEKKLTLARRVVAALRGDTDSYEVLFKEAAPDLWVICKKYFLTDDDAKDALSDTFVTLSEKFADQKDPTDFLGWAKRIAYLTCAEKASKAAAIDDEEVKDLALATLSDYKKEKKDGVLTQAQVTDLTTKVLSALPIRQRSELLLWNEGYSVAEIAKKLGISVGAAVGGLNAAKGKVEDETAKWEADGFDYTKYAATPMAFFTRLMREKFDGSYTYALPADDDKWSWSIFWDGLKGKLKWPALGVGTAAAAGLVAKFKDIDLNLPGFTWKGADVDAKLPDVDLPDVDLKAKAADLKADIDAKLPDVDLKKPDVELPKVDVDAKLPDVDVDVKKREVDLKKVGAGVAAGAAAVGAGAAAVGAKLKDVDVDLPKVDVDAKLPDVDLPDVEIKKPEIDLPDVDLKAKAADLKADIDAKLPDVELKKPEIDVKAPEVELPKVDVDAKLPDVDIKTPDVELPKVDVDAKLPDVDVDVKKPDVDLKKVGAGVAAGAAAVGAAAAAKKADLKADVDADAAALKADLDAKVADLKAGTAAAKAEVEEKVAPVAAAAGKKKGLAGIWKWLLPLLALLLLLAILIAAMRGCKSGKVDGDLNVNTGDVTVVAPGADIDADAEAELDGYIANVGIDTETVSVAVDGTTLDISTIDPVRFVKGLNVINVNPAAFVRAISANGSDLANLSYLFPNIPEITDGTLQTLKFKTGIGQDRAYNFAVADGKIQEATLTNADGKVLETVTYNYDRNGDITTITTENGTINYADDIAVTGTTKDEAQNIVLQQMGSDWAAYQYNANGTVDVVTYEVDGKTDARAFAYNDDGVLKTYESFQNIMG